MKLTWTSPYQTHDYEPLYLANGTFGGMLDLSGTTMDLWSADCGAVSASEGSDERLWPVTAIRLQAYYRNPYWKEANFWIGRTGIHCDDPAYLTNPSMPHAPQMYQCRQELDLDAGLATTEGTLYPGSQAALEAALAPERKIPFKARVAFLKDSTLMGMEIEVSDDTDVLIVPEPILEEIFAIENSAKGISTLGNGMKCDIRLRQEIIESSATEGTLIYRIQPHGDAPYTVTVRCPGAQIEELAGRPGLLIRGKAFCLVEILPQGKTTNEQSIGKADAFFQEHARRWQTFWDTAAVTLPESESLWQERYRTSLFNVAQSMTDGAAQPVGMSKPMLPYWHGCFHDTDTYFARPMLETGRFFEANRHLLFRLRTLKAAKAAAARHNRSGALYPWQADPQGNGEIIDVPMNNAIIAVEAWHQFQHNRNEDDRKKASTIVAEVFRNLLDHVDLQASPMTPKPDPLMTFSEVMTATDPTEFRLALRAVAKAVISADGKDADLKKTANRVLDELQLPEDPDGSIAFSSNQDPLYARVGSVTLGSFPLHCLAGEPGLRGAFDRELARQVFLTSWQAVPVNKNATGEFQLDTGGVEGVVKLMRSDYSFGT